MIRPGPERARPTLAVAVGAAAGLLVVLGLAVALLRPGDLGDTGVAGGTTTVPGATTAPTTTAGPGATTAPTTTPGSAPGEPAGTAPVPTTTTPSSGGPSAGPSTPAPDGPAQGPATGETPRGELPFTGPDGNPGAVAVMLAGAGGVALHLRRRLGSRPS